MRILHILLPDTLPAGVNELRSHVMWLAGFQASEGHDVTVAVLGGPEFQDPTLALYDSNISLPGNGHVLSGALRGTRAELMVYVPQSIPGRDQSAPLLGSVIDAISRARGITHDVVHIHEKNALGALQSLNGAIRTVATDWNLESIPAETVDALVDPSGRTGHYIPWLIDPAHADPSLDLALPARYDRSTLGAKKESRIALRKLLGFGHTGDPLLFLVFGHDDALPSLEGFQFVLMERSESQWASPAATLPEGTPMSLALAGVDGVLVLHPQKAPFETVLRASLYGTPTLLYGNEHWNLMVDYDIPSFSGTGMFMTPEEGPVSLLLDRFQRLHDHAEAMTRLRQWNMDARERILMSAKAYLALYEELIHGSQPQTQAS